MGNTATKESRGSPNDGSQSSSLRSPASPSFGFSMTTPQNSNDQSRGLYSARTGRGSRHDLFNVGVGASEREADPNGPRRETRQERDARKLEKERVHRAKERERSLREEGVDGGYLVTLGTYVGPEDFSKAIVRQMQIERRLAPFWRGLNDHSSSWTEHQLVAAARGLPIPAPDEIPPQDDSPSPTDERSSQRPNNASAPIAVRSIPHQSYRVDTLGNLPVNQSLNLNGPSSSPGSFNTPSPLFRGRSKTLASLTSTKNNSQTEITPQEIQLPKNTFINGQPLEAYIYKDAAECPICFLYYPQYLNRTRCCDQPICSECFVQIKRPDPHPPEHTDPNSSPPAGEPPRPHEEDGQLVCEPATCPFCVMPEFGVTYEAPPFRRGLAYANHQETITASPRSLGASTPTRRRGQSISATAPGVITTDTVRPDWAKKLSDARSQAARRSAAATALHTAAYLMGGANGPAGFGLGRRRRTLLVDPGNDNGTPRDAGDRSNMQQLLAMLESQDTTRGPAGGPGDLFPGRGSSRNNRTEDIEEIMMMEAIRQSLAAEEERKKKEEKETAKQAKKDEKQRAKDQKKADKVSKKTGSFSSSRNNSGFFSSSSNLAEPSSSPADGKGKAKASGQEGPRGMTGIGFNPLDEPTSTVNMEGSSVASDPQKHLEQSRANLGSEKLAVPGSSSPPRNPFVRSASYASSSDSSIVESQGHQSQDSLNLPANGSGQHLPFISSSQDNSSSGVEPMFNFGSLAEMIGKEEAGTGSHHVEDTEGKEPVEHSRHGSGESSAAAAPPHYGENGDAAEVLTPKLAVHQQEPQISGIAYDQKHGGNVSIVNPSHTS